MQQQQPPPMQVPGLQVAYAGGGGAGGSSARAREEASRAELFAGGAGAGAGPSAPAPAGLRPLADYDAMDNRQLADHAVAQHKDTTASAKRSLAIVEQTKEIQATTLAALRDQGRQMQNVSAGMDRLGSDLSYSERMLKFMRRCCCVGLLCACCFEPTGKIEEDREWRANGGGGDGEDGGGPPTTYKIAPPPPAIVALQQREARERAEQAKAAKKRGSGAGAAGPAAAASAAYRGPSGSGLAATGLGEQAGQVSDETARQNDYLDQISAGLDHLKQGAVAMNAELRRQEAHATEMGDDAHALHARLQAVNRQGFRGI